MPRKPWKRSLSKGGGGGGLRHLFFQMMVNFPDMDRVVVSSYITNLSNKQGKQASKKIKTNQKLE